MESKGYKYFTWFNNTFLIFLSLLCIFPLIHVLALSFSSSSAASAGLVKLWPVEFTLSSYEYVAAKTEFWRSMFVSFQRILIGGFINFILTVLLAYPLSRETREFKPRTFIAWFLFMTMLFHGGLIPWYIVIKEAGLLDSIWALVLPNAVPVFNVILLINFLKQIPKELDEAARMDGAGHWAILWKIYVPLSTPVLATITLFSLVMHWNSWFDGLILMNSPENYPLQSFLQTVIIQQDLTMITSGDLESLSEISDRTLKAAQIFLGCLPIILVYPFLQRYFVKGIVIGSVKG
ncbi:carbohydrate ABC transporter permease [Gracilibacillus sp. YIM 98692]|uniref:carbohydrate ABC transporter permease n=1 Tax=Gracilibacillus sp. YIM 98692 TaxID=2663532 RepID=UPI0013D4FDB2|nr:carbohydrate ABC transporter permease [Gracilibacillus sp. YIM 98692]